MAVRSTYSNNHSTYNKFRILVKGTRVARWITKDLTFSALKIHTEAQGKDLSVRDFHAIGKQKKAGTARQNKT